MKKAGSKSRLRLLTKSPLVGDFVFEFRDAQAIASQAE